MSVGCSKDRECCKVLFAVASLGRWVDKDDALGGPDNISAPHVSVGACGRVPGIAYKGGLGVVVDSGVEFVVETVEEGLLLRGERCGVGVGCKPVACVVATPGTCHRSGVGEEAQRSFSHPAVSVEAIRWGS